jgi:hypothetical protein
MPFVRKPRFIKKGKFKNTPTFCSRLEHWHRSKLEVTVCELLQMTKDILTIEVEVNTYLTRAKILYVADFRCTRPSGEVFYVEAKGKATATWMLKKRLWKHYGPAELHVYKGTYLKPVLDEIIKPLP